jgi:hypothetical protein
MREGKKRDRLALWNVGRNDTSYVRGVKMSDTNEGGVGKGKMVAVDTNNVYTGILSYADVYL